MNSTSLIVDQQKTPLDRYRLVQTFLALLGALRALLAQSASVVQALGIWISCPFGFLMGTTEAYIGLSGLTPVCWNHLTRLHKWTAEERVACIAGLLGLLVAELVAMQQVHS